MMNRRSLSAAVCLALLAGACSGSGSGAMSPSAVPADATVTESFSAVVSIGGAVFRVAVFASHLAPGGSSSRAFAVAAAGTVTVTLT